jgi:hypothetical protein
MASTPVIILSKRSGNSSDRPNAATVQAGEVAMSFGSADPGLYFKDSAGLFVNLVLITTGQLHQTLVR